MDKKNSNYDVVIIGAGWSGLLACKYCLAEGLKTVVIEGRDRIGGVWAFTDDEQFAGVMKSTRTTSSRCITEISDFPMPSDYPDFPSHSQIYAYLRSYCADHLLDEHIALSRPVDEVAKVGDIWRITTADGTEWTSASLIVASGVHREPNDLPDDQRFLGYSGTLAHSVAFKEIPAHFSGKTVAVWGGGETASDIAFETGNVASHVYFCIPNGQWFVPRLVDRWPPFPSVRRKVVDHTSSRLRHWLSPTHQYSPLIYQYIEYAFGFNGHGQEAWRTAAPYHRAFFNKSAEVLAQVKSGKITPKRDISRCDGMNVHFTDATSAAVDHIIMCSGYRAAFPFFDESVNPGTDQRKWFKYIFYNADPSLAFVGFVRPIVGSIPGIAELQSRYVAKVFSGKCRLPDTEERAATTNADAMFWNHHFRFTSLRLSGLVDHFLYSNQLARLIGCYPDFKALFLSSPRQWWRAIIAPWNSCQFWLNDVEHRDRIFETYRRYDENRISQNYIFLAFAPLLPLLRLYTHLRIILEERFMGKAAGAAQPAVVASGPMARASVAERPSGCDRGYPPSMETERVALFGNLPGAERGTMATVAAKEVVLRVVEMLSGARSREEAPEYIDPLVIIHMDLATHRGIEMWHKWVYLLRNGGYLRDLRFLPCELYLDAENPCVVNVIGSWVGFGRFDGLPRTAPDPSYFRYRLESNRIVELWTRRSNYDFVLGRWLRFSVFYRLYLGWAALHFRSMSRKGLDYHVDRAS